MNDERLEKLLDHYLDEGLAPDERAELEALLLSSPQARTRFWERARFHALLRRRGRENWGRRLAVEKLEDGVWMRWRARWHGWWESLRPVGWWAAAGLATTLMVFAWLSRQTPAFTDTPAEMAAVSQPVAGGQGVATILRAVGVKWTGGKQGPGNVLGPGLLKFESGLIELQFHRGARVIIEGPAEFELITDMQARCLAGKVRAEVPPPSIGFEILAPNVRVVDRGTAFGMDVQRDGPAEIHVFSGKVDFSTTQAPQQSRELLQGSAVRVDERGGLSDLPGGSQKFVTEEAITKQANASMAARFAEWRQQSQSWREDPSLLVQYTFDEDSMVNRTLINHAPNAARESQGTIIGCSWTEGRWPGKKALDFKQIGDRVRLALPRKHEELTCVTWVRLDGMGRAYTALLMSGDATVGELQWQFRGDGKILFGKRKEPGWGVGKLFLSESEPVLGPERCGSWMQLAFVYDAHARTLTHYLDGQPIGARPMNAQTPLTTDAIEIGNWTPSGGDPVEPIRAFNGRMDEFLVFSRALRSEEIARLWAAGSPF